MSDWGVTDRGFRRKAYYDIIASMEQKAKDLFGADIDLSSASPLALFLRVVAFGLSLLWAVAEKVYYSAFVGTSTGQSLDYAVKYAGIARRSATPARRVLQFTGDPDVVVPAGFLVETEDGTVRLVTTDDATIGTEGTAQILAEAETPGVIGNLAPGTITVITNPLPGLSAVTNIESGDNVDGLNRETDRELRERYFLSLSAGGASTIDAILASVLEVPGVRTARVFHNPLIETDAEGRPPKSVEVVTLGGAEADIAQAIHQTIAAGIQPYGQIEVVVKDAGGQYQTIRFSRAEVIDIHVNATVTTNTLYPLDGDSKVQDAIVAYIGGMDNHGEPRNGLGLGQDVIWTALIEAARSVPGVQDVSIAVGTASNPVGTSNITIADREVAEGNPVRVVVNSA